MWKHFFFFGALVLLLNGALCFANVDSEFILTCHFTVVGNTQNLNGTVRIKETEHENFVAFIEGENLEPYSSYVQELPLTKEDAEEHLKMVLHDIEDPSHYPGEEEYLQRLQQIFGVRGEKIKEIFSHSSQTAKGYFFDTFNISGPSFIIDHHDQAGKRIALTIKLLWGGVGFCR